MALSAGLADTAWRAGRLDAADGPPELLFGRMHEDSEIERCAFASPGRIFCIASAGCTAISLSERHEVVAADLNPVQVEYARGRFAGAPARRGAAERAMGRARMFEPMLGWTRTRLADFLDLDDPAEQLAYWRRVLDTRRFRAGIGLAFARPILRAIYAAPFLEGLPARFGSVLAGRLERCFSRHANRANPHARALLLGEFPDSPVPPEASRIRLVCADAAGFLEREPAASYDGFSLSNILDGATDAYRRRLAAAVARAAKPGAIAILRSFAEPGDSRSANLAADDRAMLWGDVRVVLAAGL